MIAPMTTTRAIDTGTDVRFAHEGAYHRGVVVSLDPGFYDRVPSDDEVAVTSVEWSAPFILPAAAVIVCESPSIADIGESILETFGSHTHATWIDIVDAVCDACTGLGSLNLDPIADEVEIERIAQRVDEWLINHGV